MNVQYSAEELAGFMDVVKKITNPIAKAGTATKNATVKIGKTASRVAKKATSGLANGICKATTNSTVTAANGAAASVPHPAAQGTTAAVSAIGSFCTAAGKGPKVADATVETAVTAEVAIVPEGRNWTPWFIGGGVALAGGIAFLATRKKKDQ
jgi:LPXTG-motif cell wall-anchored protein